MEGGGIVRGRRGFGGWNPKEHCTLSHTDVIRRAHVLVNLPSQLHRKESPIDG